MRNSLYNHYTKKVAFSYYEKIGDAVTCIDDELPFDIPDNWKICRFSSIYTLISGKDLKPSEYNNQQDGIPYITGASNFFNGNVAIIRWTPVPQVITDSGDLLITCKGTIGEIAINTFGKAHIARQIMAIRNIIPLNTNYFSICMKYYVEELKNSAKGLIPGISRDNILTLLLPVPPLDEQKRIAEQYASIENLFQSIEKSLN